MTEQNSLSRYKNAHLLLADSPSPGILGLLFNPGPVAHTWSCQACQSADNSWWVGACRLPYYCKQCLFLMSHIPVTLSTVHVELTPLVPPLASREESRGFWLIPCSFPIKKTKFSSPTRRTRVLRGTDKTCSGRLGTREVSRLCLIVKCVECSTAFRLERRLLEYGSDVYKFMAPSVY